MRTSSFSNSEVVSTIGQYFIPVWTSNDDYGREKRSKADLAELSRIKRQASTKKLSNGAVNVFVVNPEGDLFDAMIVSKAMEPQNLMPMLRKSISDLALRPRDPAAIRASASPQVQAPAAQAGGIMLHIFTRYLPPAEQSNTDDFVELTADDCRTLVPPPDSKSGSQWDVDPSVLEKVFAYCYPSVCHYDAKTSKIRKAALKARVTDVTSQEMQVTLTGELDMDHSRDGNIDGRVTAKVIGLLRYDLEKKAIASIQIVSENGEYVWHWNGKPSRYRIGFVIETAQPGTAGVRTEAKREN